MKEKLQYVTNNIKSYRIRAGLSQKKAAEMLNVSRFTYCGYEVNPQKVKVETLQKMSIIFKCKISDFFVELDDTISDIIKKK